MFLGQKRLNMVATPLKAPVPGYSTQVSDPKNHLVGPFGAQNAGVHGQAGTEIPCNIPAARISAGGLLQFLVISAAGDKPGKCCMDLSCREWWGPSEYAHMRWPTGRPAGPRGLRPQGERGKSPGFWVNLALYSPPGPVGSIFPTPGPKNIARTCHPPGSPSLWLPHKGFRSKKPTSGPAWHP